MGMWIERAGIFYIWFIQGKNPELLIPGGAFKSKKLGNIGQGTIPTLTWVPLL